MGDVGRGEDRFRGVSGNLPSSLVRYRRLMRLVCLSVLAARQAGVPSDRQ